MSLGFWVLLSLPWLWLAWIGLEIITGSDVWRRQSRKREAKRDLREATMRINAVIEQGRDQMRIAARQRRRTSGWQAW